MHLCQMFAVHHPYAGVKAQFLYKLHYSIESIDHIF
jgi:hypothetical protein